MINCHTKDEMRAAWKSCESLANGQLGKSAIGFGAGIVGFLYGIKCLMDFAFLKSKGEVYRKISVDSLNIID